MHKISYSLTAEGCMEIYIYRNVYVNGSQGMSGVRQYICKEKKGIEGDMKTIDDDRNKLHTEVTKC